MTSRLLLTEDGTNPNSEGDRKDCDDDPTDGQKDHKFCKRLAGTRTNIPRPNMVARRELPLMLNLEPFDNLFVTF